MTSYTLTVKNKFLERGHPNHMPMPLSPHYRPLQPKLRISFKRVRTGDCGTTMLDEGKIGHDPDFLSPIETHKPLEIKTLTSVKSRMTLNDFHRSDSSRRRLSRPIILTKSPSIHTKILDQSKLDKVEPGSGTPSNSHGGLVDKMKSSTTCVWPQSLPGPEIRTHNIFLDR